MIFNKKIFISVFFIIFSILIFTFIKKDVKTDIKGTIQNLQLISRIPQTKVQSSTPKKCFVLLNSNDVKSLLQVKDFIKKNGGKVDQMFPPNSMIANLTTSLQNYLRINYNARVDCFFPITIPSEIKYGKNAVNAAKVWNSGTKFEIPSGMEGLSWGDPRIGKESVSYKPTQIK